MTYSKVMVTRMVLYFKLDRDNHLWLMWSSLMRTEGEDGVVLSDADNRD